MPQGCEGRLPCIIFNITVIVNAYALYELMLSMDSVLDVFMTGTHDGMHVFKLI